MSTLIFKDGDIFNSTAPGVAHSVSAAGKMDVGMARSFRLAWPEMFEQYVEACRTGELYPGGVIKYEAPSGVTVFTIASQADVGYRARMEWLYSGVSLMLDYADVMHCDRIAVPRMGSGMGGLDQDEVEAALREIASSHVCDIEIWTLKVGR